MDRSALTMPRRLAVTVAVAVAVGGCGPGGAMSPDGGLTDPASTTPAESASPTATSAPTAARPVVGAGESWIAFQWFTRRSEIALMRPDGSGAHSPTTDIPGGDQTNPDWSPDGERLVFGVTSGDGDDLWVVDADGTGPELLVDCEAPCLWLDDPAWSADGGSILFSRMALVDGAGVGTLELLDVASGAIDVLVTAAAGDFYAGQRWSPDGASVVLEIVHRVGTDPFADVEDVTLAVIDLASPSPAGRALTEPGHFPETAAWSNGGIVFAQLEQPGDEGTDLYVIQPDGTGLRRITNLATDGGRATHPDVSADGERVVFLANLPGDARDVLAAVGWGGGEVGPATGGTTYVEGVHPRVRPVP